MKKETRMMDDATKLPEMEDAALSVLRENAERLEKIGTSAQQSAASALLPAIDAELAARREAKLTRARAARASRAAEAKSKPKATPASKRKAS
ncbi:MAG: hypothetical protein ACREH6_04455 [Geminicoccaceae bacterium]